MTIIVRALLNANKPDVTRPGAPDANAHGERENKFEAAPLGDTRSIRTRFRVAHIKSTASVSAGHHTDNFPTTDAIWRIETRFHAEY